MFDFERHRTEAENPIITHFHATFVLGLRRSGTSIVRRCLNEHDDIDLMFEPRDLWWLITQGHLKRFRVEVCKHSEILQRFLSEECESAAYREQITGAKFAFEPGITAMYWRHIELRFVNAKFIFVKRNAVDTYASYYALDKDGVPGVTAQSAFNSIRDQLYESFDDFAQQFPRRCAFVQYEDLIAEKKLPAKVWGLLDVEPVDVSGMIRMPKNTEGMTHATS